MTRITLSLPFALPPPELANDLMRALQAPSLALLLARGTRLSDPPPDPSGRRLPHESWLAGRLGLDPVRAGFATQVMRAVGLTPAPGTWFLVEPVHIQIARNHLLMADSRRLTLADEESRSLFQAAQPYFEDSGVTLCYGGPRTWFARADAWSELDLASSDAATGQNLHDWMPQGGAALACRKLHNEIQMLWHAHPVNEARQARGANAVNAFWAWAGAQASAASSVPLTALDAPPWLAAIGQGKLDAALSSTAPDSVLVQAGLIGAAQSGDWASWLASMAQLEQTTFAPLLARLRAGDLGELRIMASHRHAMAEFATTPGALRKFWRRPSLARLLP